MNIVRNAQTPLFESESQQVNRLYESYQRSKSKRDFLAENGASEENEMIYAFIGLNEAVKNDTKRFTFENGMFIPGINPKVTGRLSLYSIAESCNTSSEFVTKVSDMICESRLGFTPTTQDKKSLTEAYNTWKSMSNLNL